MNYSQMYDRANAISKSITDRARDLARRAGLDPNCPYHHAHNAMVAYEAGRPWREVDYSLCRRILWLQEKSYQPHRILSSWASKRR